MNEKNSNQWAEWWEKLKKILEERENENERADIGWNDWWSAHADEDETILYIMEDIENGERQLS